MIDELKGKKVGILVAFNGKCIKGIVNTCSTFGGETFIILDNGTMVNIKHVQTIQIIK